MPRDGPAIGRGGASGHHPQAGRAYGKVVVRDGTKVIATRTLKPGHRGKLTVTLPKLKNGKHRIRVTLAGNAVQTARTTPVKRLTVRR